MKVAGLFAGVGGIEFGLGKAGFESSLLCEIDPRAKAVLEHRFPGVRIESDVTCIDRLPRDVDLVTAGFPCQDLSQAGKTNGIFGRRSGLIRSVFRLIGNRRPPWILIENVPFLLRLDGGKGIAYITRSFEQLGYRWAYRVVNTQAFGLPHRRERVFLLASRSGDPAKCLLAEDASECEPETGTPVAHGFYWTEGNRGLGWAVDSVPTIKGGSAFGIPSPPAIWFPDGRFVTPDIRDAERLQGFPANWTKPAEKMGRPSYRWTLVGNAVSVPVARWIGRRMLGHQAVRLTAPTVELHRDSPWPRAAFGEPGVGRFAVEVGSFPVLRARRHLHEFLNFEPAPLSRRAADGFRKRLMRSSLSRPEEFDEALIDYVRLAA
jgi:DNA (cytosine-5)-methyltransferase 1